ncbi:MAG: hypothetical protein ACNYWU_01625 [Desulfobacterales bacterium]
MKKSDVISETALLSEVALSEDWNPLLVKSPFSDLSSSKLRISWIFAFASTNYGECARLLRFNSKCSALTDFAKK